MIKKTLHNYRKKIIIHDLTKLLCISIGFTLLLTTTLAFFENIFYFNNKNREILYTILLTISILSIIYIILYFIIKYFNLFNNLNDIDIANKLGKENYEINDKLINVLQIQKNNLFNQSLIAFAISKINTTLEQNFKIIKQIKFPVNSIYFILISLCLFMTSLFFMKINDPINRIINYNQTFDVPTPFKLISQYGNFSALEGDSILININGSGNLPDSITLFIKDNKKIDEFKIPKINDAYEYLLINRSSNIIYWSEYLNKNLFSKWDKISTRFDTINIKTRPKIIRTKFVIKPPSYTKKKAFEHTQLNISQIEAIKGSQIEFEMIASNSLVSSWIIINNKRQELKTSNNKILHDFILDENTQLSVFCLDENYISNINPNQYTFISKKDSPPQIIIKSPEENFEINESYLIEMSANIIDDIGLSKVWVEYAIHNPDFPEFNNKIDTMVLYSDNDAKNKNFLLKKNWDITKLNLLMGDELHFHVFVQDNNTINENITKSKLFIGSFPSLENIFTEINSNQEETFESMEDVQESIENISEITEDIKLDLLKSDEISWEEKQKLDDTFSDIEKIKEEIKSMENAIEKVLENAKENNLFDNNLTEKFEQLQNMLQNIMSPELQEAIKSLQEAMMKDNMQDTIEAMENYEFNLEKLEEQIDRFIDMFELALAEQKLNEISEHIENMINKQYDLINNIIHSQKINSLSKQSIKQENRFINFETLLNEAESLIQNISNEVSQEIENLINAPILLRTKNKLENQTNNIKNSNKESSILEANDANKNLIDILDLIEAIKEQFNEQNKQKLSKEFVNILNSFIAISNQQEKIINESKGIRSNSPQIKRLNKMQFNIDQELIQITSQIIDLSNKTFFINPKINRYIGQLKTSINKSISYLEQKQINQGKKEQKNIIKNINETIILLLESMNEMKNSQQTSGFEQFMESLKEISNGQKGLNQQTMQMGGMGSMGMMQQKIMEELQKKQEELKNKLEELLGSNPGQDHGGGLNQTKEEMDEIIKDFINNNITQKTIERQQRILSRMLDNQKSLSEKDYEKKRESTAGNNFEYTGPIGLPINEGEKDLLLMKALEATEKENLSLEYNKLIQTYFLNMQNNQNNNEN